MENIPIKSAVKRLLQNFCSRVDNREFYLYDRDPAESKVAVEQDEQDDFTPQMEKDFEICRGLLYYLMEDLPYVPQEMWP